MTEPAGPRPSEQGAEPAVPRPSEQGAPRPSAEGAEPAAERAPWRLWDHIGMISGGFLGLLVFAFLIVLAIAGDPDAITLLVFIVACVALIIAGGKLGFGRR
jgi:hypothetical protein